MLAPVRWMGPGEGPDHRESTRPRQTTQGSMVFFRTHGTSANLWITASREARSRPLVCAGIEAMDETDKKQELMEVARTALGHRDVLQDGWDITRLERRDVDLVVVSLQDPEGGLVIGLEWGSAGDEGCPAFRRGPRYRSSYRRGPGLWDIDDEGTPQTIRDRAMRACEALAALEDGPDIQLAVSSVQGPGDDDDESLEDLARRLEAGVRADLGSERMPGSGGWALTGVRLYQRWAPVVEVLLAGDRRTLAFIVSPGDEARPAFCRTRRYDLVYYSDDLAPSEHDALYLRDQETIEGFALWFRAWDES